MSLATLPDIIAAGSLAFGLTAGVAAWRMRLESRADRLALRLAMAREAAFVEAARRLSDAARLSIESVRDEINRGVRALTGTIDSVLFFEEHDGQLVCVSAYGMRVDYFGGTRFALDAEDLLLIQALRRGHRVCSADVPHARLLHPGDAFAAAIPLVLEAGRRCVLYVGGDRETGADLIDRIVALVDGATPAYRIALERADDRASAQFDGLTGLLTARAFRVRFAELIEATRFASLGRVGLLFVDTDRFKQWNDTYGHASGDALLRELAKLLGAAALDPADIVARNGGDEFCVVFAATEKSQAIERAERLRASIADADFRSLRPAGVDADVRISASIGVACFPIDAHAPSELLERADEAMYHSKKSGRNAVSYFGTDGRLVANVDALGQSDPERRRS